MVVDDAHKHVFVTGGHDTTALAVLDYDGNLVTTITGLAGPTGMTLNPATSTL